LEGNFNQEQDLIHTGSHVRLTHISIRNTGDFELSSSMAIHLAASDGIRIGTPSLQEKNVEIAPKTLHEIPCNVDIEIPSDLEIGYHSLRLAASIQLAGMCFPVNMNYQVSMVTLTVNYGFDENEISVSNSDEKESLRKLIRLWNNQTPENQITFFVGVVISRIFSEPQLTLQQRILLQTLLPGGLVQREDIASQLYSAETKGELVWKAALQFFSSRSTTTKRKLVDTVCALSVSVRMNDSQLKEKIHKLAADIGLEPKLWPRILSVQPKGVVLSRTNRPAIWAFPLLALGTYLLIEPIVSRWNVQSDYRNFMATYIGKVFGSSFQSFQQTSTFGFPFLFILLNIGATYWLYRHTLYRTSCRVCESLELESPKAIVGQQG
jgi:hypothetical protein